MDNKNIILNYDLIKMITYGAGFFGGGGGGAVEEGIKLLEEMGRDVRVPMIDLMDMEEKSNEKDVVSVMVAALGSPIATKGKTFSAEAVNAVRKIKEIAEADSKVLKYIYSLEQGSGNTIMPIYAAWKLGLPLLDVDSCGRAVPSLDTTLQAINEVPVAPMVLASEKDDTMVARTKDPLDSRGCEKIARNMCLAYDQGIGIAAWLMTKSDHMRSSAVGQMTKALRVGNLFLGTKTQNILTELKRFLLKDDFRVIVENGTIQKIIMDTEGGFDTGRVIVLDNQTNKEYTILFQNESLVVSGPDHQVYGTVPSIISLIDMGQEYAQPLSNSEISEKQKVSITVTRAAGTWYTNPKGYSCWRDVLVRAGYCDVKEQVD